MLKFLQEALKFSNYILIELKKFFGISHFSVLKHFKRLIYTDLIQDMVDMGVSIHCVIIERGWKEIDTVEDYEKAIINE